MNVEMSSHRRLMPAEWERHEATWFAWPHNRTDWPGKMSVVPWAFAEMVRKICSGEKVRIIVNDSSHRRRAESVLKDAGVDLSRVEFFPFGTDRSWTRDFGPIFARTDAGLAISRFRFNSWARYRNWQKDDAVPEKASEALGLPLVPATIDGREVVLEGGSIEVNGRGTLITTEQCLLDKKKQARNPGLNRKQMEKVLSENLGAEKIIWLGKGISGDDTHGHVDDLCRFVNEDTLVLCRSEDPSDPDHVPLEENRERLEQVTLQDGSRPTVVFLPMPQPLYFRGHRLPASYANFYIANDVVLVPTFNAPKDRVALGILGELFVDRPVVGIHSVDLVWGLGSIHCLTQQQPVK